MSNAQEEANSNTVAVAQLVSIPANDESGQNKGQKCGNTLKFMLIKRKDTKKNERNALNYHVKTCKKIPGNEDKTWSQLSLQPFGDGESMGTLSTWKFDQAVVRKSLARMIIVDELPIKFVESEGFIEFIHKGESIGMAIETCLLDWGIDKVFTLTIDNASSNDVDVEHLKRKLINWGTAIANGKWVREAVKYIRSSPTRLKKFKECADSVQVEYKSTLCLDVCTRWNSTYLMLSVAEKYEKAFERFELEDLYFRVEVEANSKGSMDWDVVRRTISMLGLFYDTTEYKNMLQIESGHSSETSPSSTTSSNELFGNRPRGHYKLIAKKRRIESGNVHTK
ncbi:zinc finger BED domain-containing protein RICESLEEPER 1-like [Canna indica]|uniref:Zinc finger BED domain-containing protein RICESLEEPER 1-like n=1 Tax=Canna indica TaxID=4628 RepID=A0AAQ3Q5F5_9LILI|nr:zinc finger BED domain-containing protein RICESLEEPER 1-like [Canna indica]